MSSKAEQKERMIQYLIDVHGVSIMLSVKGREVKAYWG